MRSQDWVWFVCDVLNASCFVVRGCAVSMRYIDVCNCHVFGVVNVYLDHLKFCVGCINGRRFVCCSECNIVSDEWNESTPALCGLSVLTEVKLCTSGMFLFGGELGFQL